MVNFTFNLLDRSGVLEKAFVTISNAINKHILRRNTLNTELITDVFRCVDGFWVKYGKSKWYGESEVRVIVGTIAESLRDNNLSAAEVRAVVNLVVSRWDVNVAETRLTTNPAELLPENVENNTLRAVEVYNQVEKEKVAPADFVALGSRAIAENLPDNKIVNGVMSALKLFK